MTDRASADLLIDRQRLSELLGRDVRTTRLRFKPGLSTTAVLLSAAGAPAAPEWIQASHPGHTDKTRKAVELAEQRGQRVHLHEVDGLTIAHGAIDTDPRLQKGLDALRPVHPSIAQAVEAGRLTVLRYNPQRRLVLRRNLPAGEPFVLRVTVDKQIGVRTALRDVASAGVPVVEPMDSPGHRLSRRVTVWPWFGRCDLASLPGDQTGPARAAGAALARLHASPLATAAVPDPVAALTRQVEDLEDLDEETAGRTRAQTAAVAARIRAGDWSSGPTHGDFSADQVLVGRPGEDPVRLTDFDRAGTAPLVADLGSFAAAELLTVTQPRDGAATPDWPGVEGLPLTAALLSGYAAAMGAGGAEGTDDALRTWTARALLARVIEPFREADPDWVAGINRRLDQVERVLA